MVGRTEENKKRSSKGSKVTVQAFFANGKIVVKDSFNFYTILSVTTSDYIRLYLYVLAGDKTMTSRNSSVLTVAGFFDNGKIIVKDIYNFSYLVNPQDLAVTQGICTNIYTHRRNFVVN
ncbi:MAG: hypothetical protein U0T83_08705 [Bacteriovoracaceae bacterium]